VLTTLFISISDALPRTAYVKMIDLWLIFNLLVPFIEIILFSLANMIYKENMDMDYVTLFRVSQNNPKRVDIENRMSDETTIKRKRGGDQQTYWTLQLVATAILPVIYILFCAIFFIYGICKN